MVEKRQVVTIEKTSKSLKLQLVISKYLFVFGLVGAFMVLSEESARATLLNICWALSGSWYLITRLRIWWNHD